jgi:hypothetical protein
MAVVIDNRDLNTLLLRLRAEQAQNRTDIQRLLKLVQRQQTAPPVVTRPPA